MYITSYMHCNCMRIANEGPLAPLYDTVSGIQNMFKDAITNATATSTRRVMLGDATVTTQSSFEPERVHRIFDDITKSLTGWQSDPTVTTNNEDIRRIFVKFKTAHGNYTIQGHFSLQFHVLLYYVPDQRVIDCQKELSDTIEASKSGEADLARLSEEVIAQEIKSRGHGDVGTQDLFEMLYQDDALRKSLESKLEEGLSSEIQRLKQRKSQLFSELDGLLTEVYQCSAVMIDDARLVTGEEGFLCTFDVEMVSNGRRQSLPDVLDSDTAGALRGRLDEVAAALRRRTQNNG